MAAQRPTGTQYRELYAPDSDPALDSEYFRVRVSELLKGEDFGLQRMHLATLFTRSMGVRGFDLNEVIMKAPVERLLSFITVLHGALLEQAEELL